MDDTALRYSWKAGTLHQADQSADEYIFGFMVAKIKSGKSLTGALIYNENKVKAGKAEFISASGFVKDHETLSFFDKLLRLTDLAGRNQLTKTNTVHISLNFDVTENLEREKMSRITDAYMERIGFGNQPYLVYQHYDAGHPHVHVRP